MAVTRTIEDGWRQSSARGNNFDALRLAAAFAVIVSHSFEIVGGSQGDEPLRVLTGGDASLGRIAVMAFFLLSGFLLTRSFISEPRLGAFARKRALRIAPALAAVVAVSALVVGPIATSLSPADYFASGDTWRYFANLAFYTGHDTLPGVFSDAPIGGVVNGPLWTLKIEVLCYLTLAAAGAMRLLKPAFALAIVVACFLGGALLGDRPHAGVSYYLTQYADLAPSFFSGVMFALLGARIALTTTAALLAAAGLLIAAPFGMVSDFFPIFGGYLVFWLGFANLDAARRAGRYGDFSYGLYLWGWPAQQIVQTAIEPAHWLANVALATPLALAAAFVSWRLVEKPALAFKLRGPALKPAPAQAALKSFVSGIPGFAQSAEAAKGDTK